jgi:SAM-dependent methyltransferase
LDTHSISQRATNDWTLEQQLSYSLRRQYVDGFLERSILKGDSDQVLLDVGGVKAQQRGEFDITAQGFKVITVNISTTKGLDIRADASRLPLTACSFDKVLCSEVLEHIDEPLTVIAEIFRVLQPGGSLIATVPFLFRLHADPVDNNRHTHWFWQHHLEKIGFSEIRIEKQGLFWSIATDMFREWLRYLVLGERVKTRLAINFFSRLVYRFRKAAINFDTKPTQQEHDFFGRYVGGFGILATKP